MLRIGIDIGTDGALAFFKDGKLMYFAFPKLNDRPDLKAFVELLLEHLNGEQDVHAVIEDLHSIFGTSAKSNFQFGWINGAMEAILTAFCVPYTKVQAKKWQKEMWEGIRPVEAKVKVKTILPAEPEVSEMYGGSSSEQKWEEEQAKKKKTKVKVDTKATSLIAAKRLFPEEKFLATVRSKVPHNGIVDAVLIAEYCKRNF